MYRSPPPDPARPAHHRPLRFLPLVLLVVALVACGGPPPPGEPGDDEDPTGAIAELIDGELDGEIRTEITVTTLSASSPQSLHTYASAFEDTPLVVEATAKTPSGRQFKMVFYGPSIDTSLVNFSGPMRLRARVANIQGKTVLRGTALFVTDAAVAPAASKKLVSAFPFFASGMGTTFSGPPEGTVFELRGVAAVGGVCGSQDVAGLVDLGPPSGPVGQTARGVFLSFLPEGTPCTPGAGLAVNVGGSFFTTAVDTHMGTFLSGPGWVGAPSGPAMPTFALLVGGELPEAVGFVRVVPAAGVRVVDAEAAAEMTSFDGDDGTLTLTELKGSLAGLAEEDVIVSTPREGAPHGFLRRVVAIEKNTGGFIVHTARAVLKDAIQEADVRFSRGFTSGDVALATAMAGATATAGETAAAVVDPASLLAPQTLFGPIDVDFDRVLYDHDGNHGTTDDQVVVTGNLFVSPRIVIDLDCSGIFCTQPDFLAKFVLDQDASLDVLGNAALQFDERVQLARIPLPPITAAILVFVPEIVVELTASGEVELSVEFHVEQGLDLEVGVEYESGSGWDTIDVLTHDADADPPTFAAELEAEAALGVEGRLMLYGVAGVSAGLELYATVQAGVPRDPAWEIRGGLRGDVDVDLDVIVWQEEFSIPVFDTDWPVATAPNAPPEITRLSAGPQCSDGSVAVDALTGLVTFDANTNDAEDGRGEGTVVWSSDVDGQLGTTNGDGHTLQVALSTMGAHVITARATDSDGAQDVDTLAIDVDTVCAADFPVVVELTIPGGAPRFFTPGVAKVFEATTRGGLPGPTCCALDWYSDVEGYLGTTNGGVQGVGDDLFHSFEHTFTEPVGQTVTAIATHGSGTTEASAELAALIPLRDPPSLGALDVTLPAGTTGYEGDTANLVLSAVADGLVWRSSDPTDLVVPGAGGSADVTFGQAGPRTLRVEARSEDGGLAVRSVRLRVDDVLARP